MKNQENWMNFKKNWKRGFIVFTMIRYDILLKNIQIQPIRVKASNQVCIKYIIDPLFNAFYVIYRCSLHLGNNQESTDSTNAVNDDDKDTANVQITNYLQYSRYKSCNYCNIVTVSFKID